MDELIKIAGKITGIYSEPVILKEPFFDFAARFASMTGTVVLMSGGELDAAQYHILGTQPWLTFTGYSRKMTIKTDNQTLCFDADPFDTLRRIIDCFSLDTDLPVPVGAGLFGYLSYDLKDCLEKLPRTSIDTLSLPHICLFAPSIIVVHNKIDKKTTLCMPKRIVSGKCTLAGQKKKFKKILAAKQQKTKHFSGKTEGFRSNFTRTDYIDAIKKIKEYIASGHVYQVNLSQRFETDFKGDGFSLFQRLYNSNPAPFFSYINAGDHQIVSTSPERFLLQTGKKIETRPIKGTRPRGKTFDEDQRLKDELKESKKDDAELSMIVDLLRNDIGKVCTAGSVRVVEHKKVESYQNVYHLVSVVEGILADGYDSVDLVTATFPGGSITGCPKIRAMEIIDELEPNRRHIYTGSVGYISFHDTMDLSIAIRTATICKEKFIFSVGGGIVFDSDPSDEYDETIHKGQTLMNVLHSKNGKAVKKPYVWINGTLKPLDQASIPVTDQGFQFGYGFFETIRVNKGKPKYLKEHIARFYQTWKYLFSGETPDLTWNDIIDQVIIQNGLADKTAAVKIIATMGDQTKSPVFHTLLTMAMPYTHRLAEKKETGINLALYPKERQIHLADHKTLNYLFYLLAAKWAAKSGADEALILNPDGTVSETNTANILLIKDKKVIRPVSSHVLPGIMEQVVCNLFYNRGYKVIRQKIVPKDLFSAGQVFITNSLMGIVPVLSLDGKKMPLPTDLWKKINDIVL